MPTLLTPFAKPSSSTAIVIPSTSIALSYNDLSSLINSLTSDLNSWGGSLAVGSVISTSLINSVEFATSFLAITNHRCIAAPLNPAYNADEVSFYLQDTQSKLLIVHANTANSPAVKAARSLGVPTAEIAFVGGKILLKFMQAASGTKGVIGSGRPLEQDVALVLHTSGTTGKPVPVPLTHRNLATTMENVVRTYSLSPADTTYLVMPLFHVHGLLAAFLAPLLSGGSIVIPPKFSAGTFWKEFIENRCTWYTAVPTIHQILLKGDYPKVMPKIRFIRSCSSALAPATFAELEKTFKAPVLEAYAMTEAAHQMTSNPPPPFARKAGTVGIGQGVKIKILDISADVEVEEGEVCIYGLNVTPGYINNPSANASSFTKPMNDGKIYFRTGDRGKLDSEGYLSLTGRLKELINRGGEKISPLEIDAVLLSLEGVGEAVAFGVADELMGEKVWAAVVLKSGTKASEVELIKRMKEKISAFKCPERIFILDAIPKTATGKIQRKALATRFTKEVHEGLHKFVKAKL